MTDKQLQSFFARVDTKSSSKGCWIWSGATGGKGKHMYGVFNNTTVHRVAYEHFRGPIPKGAVLDHVVCDIKMCANPYHVEPRTQRQNLHRSPATLNAINANKTHCVNGHPFTKENTYISKTNGQRVCRMCKRLWARQKRAAHG